ncbi:MAG: alpha/beta hydrolase family protein [Clostridia bacterium]|nr:alpha/beta hydrolase family protein [Clostridia bacterium]
MAVLNCSYRSVALEKNTMLNVILPDVREAGVKIRALYLLHGYTDDYSAWMTYTSIGRYVRDENIAVIMPDAQKSFYADMYYGDNYYTYISKELPHWCEAQFNISCDRNERYIAGLSMGGYGALKIGLSNIDSYRAIGAFSPACNVKNIQQSHELLHTAIMGPGVDSVGSDADLYKLCENAENAGKMPLEIYHWCGSDDFMIEDNREFAAYMRNKSFCNYTFCETDGDHSWVYWDREVEKFIGIIKKLN